MYEVSQYSFKTETVDATHYSSSLPFKIIMYDKITRIYKGRNYLFKTKVIMEAEIVKKEQDNVQFKHKLFDTLFWEFLLNNSKYFINRLWRVNLK